MGHSHHHGDPSQIGERRLWWAVSANILLTVAQVIGGILSGSLSLVADALHNFSDAASLLIALVAIRIGRKPPDQFKTFGYKRAETVAALINLTTLIIIGLYLCYEAIKRFITPEPVAGWTVVIVAGIALSVTPDYKALGKDKDWADEWARHVESEWRSWAESTSCDAAQSLTFAGMTSLIFRSSLINGEALALPLWLDMVN